MTNSEPCSVCGGFDAASEEVKQGALVCPVKSPFRSAIEHRTLAQVVLAHKGQRVERRPWRSYNSSGIGGRDCDRFIWFARTMNEKGAAYTPETQCRFDYGNLAHEAVRRDLVDAGYQILAAHGNKTLTTYWPEYDLTGVVDGFARAPDGEVILFEIKSVSDNRARSITTANDFLDDWWDRKDLTQLGLYMFLNNWDGPTQFYFYQRGVPSSIPIVLEDVIGPVSEALERIKRVQAHIERGTEARPRSWSWDICERCDFLTMCPVEHPSLKGEVIDDDDLNKTLQDRERLMAIGRLYNAADRKVRNLLKRYQFDVALCGDYRIRRGGQTKIERIGR